MKYKCSICGKVLALVSNGVCRHTHTSTDDYWNCYDIWMTNPSRKGYRINEHVANYNPIIIDDDGCLVPAPPLPPLDPNKYICSICGKPVVRRDNNRSEDDGFAWEHEIFKDCLACNDKWKLESNYYNHMRGIKISGPEKEIRRIMVKKI